ncbi:MAG: RNA 2'-phosphotransferase [Bacteroidales bacterium]
MDKNDINISKFLSLVLRHKPEIIGIQLDSNGWTDIDTLIEKSNEQGIKLTKALLKHIVETNPKKRFAIDESFSRIRANQGHSVSVELGYESKQPPEFLFHGTSEKSVSSILKSGLEKRKRHHVHLSSDIETATNVGKRHGKPFVFIVMAKSMFGDNFKFYLSENGVWLTDHVPAKYLKRKEE